jgi:hypothetical protein
MPVASESTIGGVHPFWIFLPPIAILVVVLGIAVPLRLGDGLVFVMFAVLIAIQFAIVIGLAVRAKRNRQKAG